MQNPTYLKLFTIRHSLFLLSEECCMDIAALSEPAHPADLSQQQQAAFKEPKRPEMANALSQLYSTSQLTTEPIESLPQFMMSGKKPTKYAYFMNGKHWAERIEMICGL